MTRNVGHVDSAARIAIGLAMIGSGFACRSWWGSAGLLPLLTGAFGFCPGYTLLGISTCSTKSSGSPSSDDNGKSDATSGRS